MADARHGRTQNLVEDQFQTVVRMQAGAQVRQAAGGGGQDAVARGAEGRRQGRDDVGNPAVQGAGQGGVDPLPSAQSRAPGQQRIGRLGRLVQGFEQQAFAHPPGGHLDPLQVQVLDQTFQHQAGVGQGFGPLLGHAGQFRQAGGRLLRDQTRGLQRLVRRDLVLVHDLQRIGFQRHMDLGQGAPGAADGVEAVGLELGRDGFQPLVDAGLDPVGVESLALGQGEGAQRQGQPLFDAARRARRAVQTSQLQTGAAHVGRDALRVGCAGQHPHGGVFRLFLAGQDTDLQARLGGDALAELRAVPGFAHGRGGGDQGGVGANPLQHGGETAQGRHGHDHPLGRQLAGGRQVAAQTGQDLFVEHGPDRPTFQPVENQTDRVGPDVDGRDVAAGKRQIRHQRPGRS